MENRPRGAQRDTEMHHCESHCFQQSPASVFHTAPLIYSVDKLCFLFLFSTLSICSLALALELAQREQALSFPSRFLGSFLVHTYSS